jgi:hypothetical protein
MLFVCSWLEAEAAVMLDIMEEFGGIVWCWLQYSQLLLAMGL